MTTRTQFTYRVDLWTSDGVSIAEHLAGAEDFQLAQPTYRAAVERGHHAAPAPARAV